MGGPIVRTGTTPKFWQNWEQVFGGKKSGTSKAKAAPAKEAKSPKKASTKGSREEGKEGRRQKEVIVAGRFHCRTVSRSVARWRWKRRKSPAVHLNLALLRRMLTGRRSFSFVHDRLVRAVSHSGAERAAISLQGEALLGSGVVSRRPAPVVLERTSRLLPDVRLVDALVLAGDDGNRRPAGGTVDSGHRMDGSGRRALCRGAGRRCGPAWIFLMLSAVGNLSGEWLVGGIEAKVVAYGLLFAAIAAGLNGQASRRGGQILFAGVLAGLAVSFHPVVGIWGVASAVFASLVRGLY